jgi:hypothetical protein
MKVYREGKKRDVVGRVLRESITSDYHIYPSFGRTIFMELTVRGRSTRLPHAGFPPPVPCEVGSPRGVG